MQHKKSIVSYFNRRLGSILLLGFSSGLPIVLCGSTLQAWFTVSGVDIITIGFLSLVGQPYAYKFLWAPLMDRFVPPFHGRRRGWMIITQICLILSIIFLALQKPDVNPGFVALIAVIIAFFSASQDIAIDAYRAEVLPSNERGLGAALGVEGYRLAMLVAGAGALLLADRFGWQTTYLVMAGLMLVGALTSLFAPEPKLSQDVSTPRNLKDTVIGPFKEFFARSNWHKFLALIILYKLGDAFVLSLSTTFLLRHIEFSLTEIATINKILALIASLLGIFLGGVIMTKVRLYKALLFFGVLQALPNLAYMILAIIGKNYALACSGIFLEYLCSGMGTAAFVALLMSLCNVKFTATQFALFSSLASFGRVFVGPASGFLVQAIGWAPFFFFTFLISFPGVFVLMWLKRDIDLMDDRR